MSRLALECAPAAAWPRRFLLLVPAWGAVAGLLLSFHGFAALGNRWAPATLALVHAFTLGVLGNAVLGSLMQFLPVAAGCNLRWPRPLALVVPWTFNLGIAVLLAGFLRFPGWLPVAGMLLATSILLFVACALAGFVFDGEQRVLRTGLLLALLAWAVAAASGLALTLGRAGWVGVPLLPWTDVHAAVAILAALVLLCGAIGSVVLPMLQGTATVRPGRLAAWYGLLLASLLVAVALRWNESIGGQGMAAWLAPPVAIFALAIRLQQVRAPHARNPTLVGFWKLGARALLAAALVAIFGDGILPGDAAVLAGALLLAIALPALVLGMLLEIAAFLGWLELLPLRQRERRLPSVDALLPEARKSRLLWAHAFSAGLLLAAIMVGHDLLARLAGVALADAHAATLHELLALRRRARRWSTQLAGVAGASG